MRSPEKTENYEYCITVPRTSVHDCSRNFGLQYQAQPSFFGRLCGDWLPSEEIQEEFNKIFMAIKTG